MKLYLFVDTLLFWLCEELEETDLDCIWPKIQF